MGILDFIFPKRCVGCGTLGQYICASCRRSMRSVASNEAICPLCERPAIDGATHPRCRTKYGLDGLTSFFHYDGATKKAIKALKYRDVSDLASEFVSLIPSTHLTHIHATLGGQGVGIIPIPLHVARLRERGYNQAEVLGEFVAEALHVSMYTDILYRTRQTTPQVATKSRKERLRNMNDVFGVRPSDIKGKSVILFDDVFTTGATTRAAANALKRSGVKRVWAVTMAR